MFNVARILGKIVPSPLKGLWNGGKSQHSAMAVKPSKANFDYFNKAGKTTLKIAVEKQNNSPASDNFIKDLKQEFSVKSILLAELEELSTAVDHADWKASGGNFYIVLAGGVFSQLELEEAHCFGD